jgi:hypothetical protein
VVILVIDELGMFPVEPESQSPVFVNPDGPMTLKRTFQLMAAPTRSVHIFRAARHVELTELETQPLRMLWLDASLGAAAKEALDAAVTKALDHGVYLYAIQATSGPISLRISVFRGTLAGHISMNTRKSSVRGRSDRRCSSAERGTGSRLTRSVYNRRSNQVVNRRVVPIPLRTIPPSGCIAAVLLWSSGLPTVCAQEVRDNAASFYVGRISSVDACTT